MTKPFELGGLQMILSENPMSNSSGVTHIDHTSKSKFWFLQKIAVIQAHWVNLAFFDELVFRGGGKNAHFLPPPLKSLNIFFLKTCIVIIFHGVKV